jgi:hypothetical protein
MDRRDFLKHILIGVGALAMGVTSWFRPRAVISGFTPRKQGELVKAIDIYQSDWGEHRIIPSRFERPRLTYASQPGYYTEHYRDFIAEHGGLKQRVYSQ